MGRGERGHSAHEVKGLLAGERGASATKHMNRGAYAAADLSAYWQEWLIRDRKSTLI